MSHSSSLSITSCLMFLHLDYCNSLLINIHFNQCTTMHTSYLPVFPLAKPAFGSCDHLLWLPIYARIEYKVCLLARKCFNGLAFGYLHSTLRLNKNECLRTFCSSLDSLFWRFFECVWATENDHLHLLPLHLYEISI